MLYWGITLSSSIILSPPVILPILWKRWQTQAPSPIHKATYVKTLWQSFLKSLRLFVLFNMMDHRVSAGDDNTQQKLGRRGKVKINVTWNMSCLKSVRCALKFDRDILNASIVLFWWPLRSVFHYLPFLIIYMYSIFSLNIHQQSLNYRF